MSLFGVLCWIAFILALMLIGERGQRAFLIGALLVVNVVSAALLVFY